jgi:hypothetical protein
VSKGSVKSDSDIAPLSDEFFKKATVAWPPVKRQVTIRLDGDVLDWLKARGKGYQTRINRILRTVMESQPQERSVFSQTKKRGVRHTSKPRRTASR